MVRNYSSGYLKKYIRGRDKHANCASGLNDRFSRQGFRGGEEEALFKVRKITRNWENL